jgi:hypothetical protein
MCPAARLVLPVDELQIVEIMQHQGTRTPLVGLALALTVLAILIVTLIPSRTHLATVMVHCVVCGERGVADALTNLILFLPLGAVLGIAGTPLGRASLAAGALSAVIEMAQFVIPGRDPSVGDVLFNTTGAVLGYLLVRHATNFVRLSPLAATVVGTLVVAGTGILLQPELPVSTYYGQWTPNLRHLASYRGQVLSAKLGDLDIPPSRLPNSAIVREQLLAGSALRVLAVAGPAVRSLAPLFSIYDDRQREIMLLGFDRKDLVFRYRTRAAAWRLDQPDMRVRNAATSVAPGDTLAVVLLRRGTEYCIDWNGVDRCRFGFTAGRGWALLYYAESFPAWLTRLLDAIWVAGLLIPVGSCTAVRPALWIGGALLATLGAAPAVAGLLSTSVVEWAGGTAGVLIGMRLRTVLSARGPRPPNRAKIN